VSDGLSSFAKLASGHWTDRLARRKPVLVAGYAVTALATASFRFRDLGLACFGRPLDRLAGAGRAHARAQGDAGGGGDAGDLWPRVWL